MSLGDSVALHRYPAVIAEWREAKTLRMVRARNERLAATLKRLGVVGSEKSLCLRSDRMYACIPASSRTFTVNEYALQFVSAVRELVTDAFLVFKRDQPLSPVDSLWENRCADRVVVEVMDASHVSLVLAEMSAAAFVSRPRVYLKEEASIGLNMNQLFKALQCADDDDRVVLLYDAHENKGRVHLYTYSPASESAAFLGDFYEESYVGEEQNTMKVGLRKRKEKALDALSLRKEMHFDLPKIFVDEPLIAVPLRPNGFTVTMPSEAFFHIASHLTDLADTLDVSIFLETSMDGRKADVVSTAHKVVFSSSYLGDLTGRHELCSKVQKVSKSEAEAMKEADNVLIDVSGTREDSAFEGRQHQKNTQVDLMLTLSFSSRYLECFSRPYNICDTVQLHLALDNPIRVGFTEPSRGLQVEYYLAPKVEE
jgi:hypothetical protein